MFKYYLILNAILFFVAAGQLTMADSSESLNIMTQGFYGYLSGAVIIWLLYLLFDLYLANKDKSAHKFKKHLVFLPIIPSFLVALNLCLFWPNIELFGYQLMLGLLFNFLILSISFRIEESEQADGAIDLNLNPYEVEFNFVQKKGERFIRKISDLNQPIYIECSANKSVHIAILVPNQNNDPHCPFKLLLANGETDLLYRKGEPMPIKIQSFGQPFKAWLIASQNKEEILKFIARTDLSWPKSFSECYKQLN